MPDSLDSARGFSAAQKRAAPVSTPRGEKDGDDFQLSPPECVSRAEYEAARLGWKSDLLQSECSSPAAESLGPRQFSVSQLLLVMTLIAVGLGGGSLLGPKMFAFVCGAAAFLSLLVGSFHTQTLMRSFWFVSTTFYFVAAAVALIRHLIQS